MSDGSIIRKIREDGKVVSHTDSGDEWFRHVREYNIFNDAQARLIADALRDVQVYMRNEYKEESDALRDAIAESMVDFVMETFYPLHDELRAHRERVAMLEGQLKAMTDLKGVPGKQGDRGPRGNLEDKVSGERKAT